ncbi:MAG: DUF1285 domain-containing protein [Rhizobiaceae bacterium]
MSDKYSPSDSPTGALEALVARAKHAGDGLPPVHLWEPDYCGELDIQIKRDGTWFYMGTPIGRAPLVRLFSTVLRKDEDGETYLVTPVEKIKIEVEDAPFVAVEMNATGEGDEQVLTFRNNVGDLIQCGKENPLRFEIIGETDQLKPYVLVRGRLEALLARPVMYELISFGEELEVGGVLMFALRSNGVVFPVMPADKLVELSA